ncbi:unnamed protein product, partial [Rotaria sordida]
MASNSSSIQQQNPIPSKQIQFSIWNTFKHHIPRFLITILVDLIFPLIIYFSLQKRIKTIYILMIAGIPPLIMVIIKFILSRTFDALGFLVFIVFLISAIVGFITHNPIVLLLEKSIITGILSIIFALTLIPLQYCQYYLHIRPLAYYFYQDLVPIKRHDVGLPNYIFENEDESINEQYNDEHTIKKLSYKKEIALVYEWLYIHCSSFRSTCYIKPFIN